VLPASLRQRGSRLLESLLALPGQAPLLLARAPSGAARLSYGRPVPSRRQAAHGGVVKLQALAEAFPPAAAFNVLYLVSSALPPAAPLLARLARRSGARVVLNQNGVATPAWPGPGWEESNRPLAAVLRQADHVVYQSGFCRRAADRFLGAARGEVLFNPVDSVRFCPGPPPRPRPLVLLLGGNQDQLYRVVSALGALASLVRRGVDARLIVTGRLRWTAEAAARVEVERRIAEAGLGDRVELSGPYTQDEAPAVLRRAHLLLHTKHNDPSPGLVGEAMACGLPVVFSRSGGVPELVGEAGLGVPAYDGFDREDPPDPEALASAVLQVEARLPELSRLARERAVTLFDERAWVLRHGQIFAELLAR
jgi:glycosyltransferase involved in cell wall biosynthesis